MIFAYTITIFFKKGSIEMHLLKFAKLLLLCSTVGFSLSISAQTTSQPDWTPILKGFEQACTFKEKSTGEVFFHNLSTQTKSGNKTAKVVLPKEYKSVVGSIKRVHKGDHAEYQVPVSGGTYYGLPIESLVLGTGYDNGILYYHIVLRTPFSTAKKQLSKVKFQKLVDEYADYDIQAEVLSMDKGKKTMIECNRSM